MDSWLVTSGLGSSEVVDWKVTAESDVIIATSDAAVAYAVIIAGVGGYDQTFASDFGSMAVAGVVVVMASETDAVVRLASID